MKIKLFPDSALKQQMPKFDFDNPTIDPKELEKNLVEFMLESNGIGLAANQVGIKTSVFVMGHRDNPTLAKGFFNPIVLETSKELLDMEEGCLSFPGVFVKIKRPKYILAKWQNSSGEWEQGKLEGYDCKCFLHEFDHLIGITFKDRVSNLKWNLANKRKK